MTTDPDAQLLVGDRAFAADLYRRLAAAPDNLFFSPWSIRTAIGMVYAGARGPTERQIAAALHDRLGQSRFHLAAFRLERALREAASVPPSDAVLLIANAVWAARDVDLVPTFTDTLEVRYAAPVAKVEFTKGDQARASINAWVEQKTRGRLRDLIPSNSFDRLTRLVVCDAIYFRSSWQHVFPTNATAPRSFHRSDRSEVRVPFMHTEQALRYGENPDLQVVEIPYRGEEFAMLLFLPRDMNGLSAVEREVDADWLAGWDSRMKGAHVRLAMPKFRIEGEFRLSDPLSAMGMGDAFKEGADFSGIAHEPLFISEAFHKAVVTVDEHGTEAAAATAEIVQSLGLSIVPPQPVIFIADHPFLFLIRDRESGTVLFMGRLVNPE
jgi:serpin B